MNGLPSPIPLSSNPVNSTYYNISMHENGGSVIFFFVDSTVKSQHAHLVSVVKMTTLHFRT